MDHVPQCTASPAIAIRTKTLGDYVVIQILDSEIGIPKEIKSKIFDLFFTTKPVDQGTGLGLSTCCQVVVETHQGYLACFSREGRGTQFVMKLPIQLPCS